MKKYFCSLIIFLIAANSIQAQLDRSIKPLPGPAPKIKVAQPVEFMLPNGAKVFVIEDHRLPKVSFSISLLFDPPIESPNQGISSLTSSLIGTGTTTKTKDEINQKIDFIGATLSPSPTGIFASSLKKHTDELLDILSDVTMHTIFIQEELDKEKTQEISGLASKKDNPDVISRDVRNALYFGKSHPYGEFETETSVKNVTLEMCKNYYDTYFRPNIACISVVGDITPSEANKLIRKYFSAWEKKDVPKPAYATPQSPDKPEVAVVDRPQSVQSVISVGYPLDMNLGNPDYIKAAVANTLLGGGSFRLFNNLREKHGYTYGAYSSFSLHPLVSSFSATASVRNAVTDSSVAQILFEMKRMRDEQVPEEELKMVKNYLTGNFSLSLENPQTIANFAVNMERYHLPANFYTNYLMNIEAVTPADIQQMSKKYFLPDKAYILVVGKASEVAQKLLPYAGSGKIDYYDQDGNQYNPTSTTKILPSGVTVKTILENYLSAIGGKEKINGIHDMSVTASLNYQGMPLSVSMLYKIPGKFLTSIKMNGQIVQKQLLNGETGSASGMQGNKEITGDELEELKKDALPFPEINYEKAGLTLVLKEIKAINGKDAFVITSTSPTGKVSTDYYDVVTYLKVRSESIMNSPNGPITSTQDFSDYTDNNGIKYPSKITQSMGSQNMEIKVESVLTNSGLSDDLFK